MTARTRRITYRKVGEVFLARAEDVETGLSVAVEGSSYEQVAWDVVEELERVYTLLQEPSEEDWGPVPTPLPG